MKCNLFRKMESEDGTKHERPTRFDNDIDLESIDLLGCYGVADKVSEIVLSQEKYRTQDVMDINTEGNKEKNSGLVHCPFESDMDGKSYFDSSSDQNSQFNRSDNNNSSSDTTKVTSCLETEKVGCPESKEERSAETSGKLTWIQNSLSPCKTGGTPQKACAVSPSRFSSHDREAIVNISLLTPTKESLKEDILNASKDSLIDAEMNNLLDGVEWSPVLQDIGHQDKCSTST